MTVEPNPSDYVELRFGPRWTYISCVRKFIASFFMIGLADKERAEQISMAASELLENAVKYASEESIVISIGKTMEEVDVCVTNSCDSQQLNVLRRELAFVTAGDAEKTYLMKMEEAAKTEGVSRLGLIRIRYEAGARLVLETKADNQVSIHAIFAVETP